MINNPFFYRLFRDFKNNKKAYRNDVLVATFSNTGNTDETV